MNASLMGFPRTFLEVLTPAHSNQAGGHNPSWKGFICGKNILSSGFVMSAGRINHKYQRIV